MKKITRILTMAFATIAFAACQQEMQELPGNTTLSLNQFGASAEGSTKVTISSDWMLSWEKGDQTDVFDGATKLVFSAQTKGASTILELTDASFRREDDKTYYAVYPSSDANTIDGATITLNVAGDRTAEVGVYPAAPAVAASTGAQANFAFMNACGLVSFEVAEGQNIASIVIFGGNGEAIAGTVKVNALTAEYEIVKGEKEITLTPSESDVFPAGRYYVAVLPQEFTAGLSVSLYAADGTRLRKNLNAFTLGRSSHVDVETGGEFKTQFTIKNADELAAFMAVADKCIEGTVATLANDIDLSGVTLPAVSSFAGKFDGAGKKLMNWTTDKPLFTKIVAGATVKGIVLDKSCTLKLIETDARHQAFIVAENAGTVSGCTNKANVDYTRSSNLRYRQFGTIVGVSSGLVSDCHNNGNISITIPKLDYAIGDGNNYQHQTIGGVVGAFDAETGSVAVENCTNTGNITFNFHGVSANELRPHMVIGGVCGLAGAAFVAAKSTEAVNNGTIKGCTNEGALTFNYEGMIGGGYSIMGGVIGYIEGTVENCANSGALNLIGGTDSASSFGAPALGGVVAAVVAGDLKNSSNTGAVHMQGKCQGGSDNAAYAGGMRHLCVGGVVGKIGTYNKEVTAYSVSDSKNSGAVSVKTGATPIVHVGGIAGWTSVPVNGSAANMLENSGTVSVLEGADMSELYVGGVIGRSISTFDTIYNTANASVTVNLTDSRDCVVRVAGVAGFMEKATDATFKQGQNRAAVNVRGGAKVTSLCYFGGVVGYSKATTVTSNNTGWDECNSNYGDISIESSLKSYVGGVVGSINAFDSGSGQTQRCKNRGNITVNNPKDGSCIGGVVGRHGRGKLGDANYLGDVSDAAVITVTGATSGTYVGGYVGQIRTSNGPTYPNCCTTISGFGMYGKVNASGATAGVIAGNVTMIGNTTTNGIMIGTDNNYNRVRIAKTVELNEVVVGDLTVNKDMSTFIATISPSTTTTRTKPDGTSLAGKYYFCAKNVTSEESVFPHGFANF